MVSTVSRPIRGNLGHKLASTHPWDKIQANLCSIHGIITGEGRWYYHLLPLRHLMAHLARPTWDNEAELCNRNSSALSRGSKTVPWSSHQNHSKSLEDSWMWTTCITPLKSARVAGNGLRQMATWDAAWCSTHGQLMSAVPSESHAVAGRAPVDDVEWSSHGISFKNRTGIDCSMFLEIP